MIVKESDLDEEKEMFSDEKIIEAERYKQAVPDQRGEGEGVFGVRMSPWL